MNDSDEKKSKKKKTHTNRVTSKLIRLLGLNKQIRSFIVTIFYFNCGLLKNKYILFERTHIKKNRIEGHILLNYLGAMVIDALRCSFDDGAKRFELNKSQSNVFC